MSFSIRIDHSLNVMNAYKDSMSSRYNNSVTTGNHVKSWEGQGVNNIVPVLKNLSHYKFDFSKGLQNVQGNQMPNAYRL